MLAGYFCLIVFGDTGVARQQKHCILAVSQDKKAQFSNDWLILCFFSKERISQGRTCWTGWASVTLAIYQKGGGQDLAQKLDI